METIDNIGSLFGDDLKQTLKPGAKVRIAASCFSIFAYEALKEELEQIDSLEFIFTSPSFLPNEVTDRIRKERREFLIPKFADERLLSGTEFEIRLRNKLTQKAIARECADWIRRKAVFRSNNSSAPMQQFACTETAAVEPTVYFPIQGFSAVELGYEKGNAVSNLVTKFTEPNFTQTYLNLFDDIWHSPERLEEVTDSICEHISTVYQENSPERIYFLMLYNIFNVFLDDINEDLMPNERTGYEDSVVWQMLYNFQRDAAVGLINKLETFNGCILADSVGLGKTFTALAVIKYYELRNKSVLVLCPKKLSENWRTYNSPVKTNVLEKDRLGYTVLNHTDLQRTRGESYGIDLNQVNWGNFDLVVIDESHNFRNANPGEEEKVSRYQQLMDQVIRAGVKTKVLMLSATPVNNHFGDLKNQLALAYEGESENLREKIGTTDSIEDIFTKAKRAFTIWTKLPVADRTAEAILDALDFDFFKLLDSVTIARSRKHIESHYDISDLGSFPERRKPEAFRPQLTSLADVATFNDIYEQLSLVTLASYTPAEYLLPSRRTKYDSAFGENLSLAGQQKGIRALMTVNLLKRLESSVASFRITLGKVKNNISYQLANIRKSESGAHQSLTVGGKLPYNFDPENDDFPETLGTDEAILLSDLDLQTWKRDLENDLSIVSGLISEMEKVTPEHDDKLQHLLSQIQKKIENPINDGNKKIIVFTAFSDTADYLYDQVAELHQKRFGLHSAKITGTSTPKSTLGIGFDFQKVLTFFSPLSKKKSLIFPDEKEEIDLLIATDCISEGQNLQDCDYLINYDIHWNPVRIIQRFGRIDRIGSKNAVIQLVNYWPDLDLDEYINLRERVANRMVIADMVSTGADNPLDPKANQMEYRKEQLRKLQEEVIEMEDLRTGVSITDMGLNDFRMDLVSFIKREGDLSRVPNGLHAIVPANPEKDLHPGTIFALRNRHEAVNINHANRLHPYYLVYISNAGEVIIDHTEVKRVLDTCRTACKGRSEPISSLCQAFNQATNDGREMSRYSSLLDQAIRSMIEKKEESNVDSLFSSGSTSALVGDISGLDDFELIAFIIVQTEQRTSNLRTS